MAGIVFICEYGNMGSKKIPVEPLEAEAIQILYRQFISLKWTAQQLANKSGMAKTSAFESIKGERSTTVSEFEKLCSAFGYKPWRVLREAEENLSARVASLDECRSQADAYINETQAKLARVLQSNYTPAAKPHQPDPDANIGEENQDTGVQND